MAKHVLVDVPALDLAKSLHLFAVLLGLVVLFAILMQPMPALDVGAFGPDLTMRAFLQLLDEAAVRTVSVHSFRVLLRSGIPFFSGHEASCS
jgi:hypothetical protein